MPVQYGGDRITFSDGSNLGSGWTGFKNRIINGDMGISQRNGTSATTINTAAYTYTLDRWSGFGKSSAGVFTIQQSTVAPAGFTNSALLTVTTAATPSGSDYYIFRQAIEGFNLQDVRWGTANAQTVTLSFWARSSVTGTFSGALFSNADNSVYPFTYVINSANTWTNISVTIAGPTSGSFTTGNGNYLNVSPLILGAGAKTTPNAWGTSGTLGSIGATDLIATNGATFHITGVQLEKGSTATSFDYRPYGTELALCQRYFELVGNGGVGSSSTNAAAQSIAFKFQVAKRATPTITHLANYTLLWAGNNVYTATATGANNASTTGFCSNTTVSSAPTDSGRCLTYVTQTDNISASAEL